MTDYIYRILLLYPESRRAEIDDWYESQFPDAGELLSYVGVRDQVQWYVASFVATRHDITRWLARLTSELGATAPEGFVDLPRETQRQWIDGMRTGAMQALGIYIDAAWNDVGDRVDFDLALQSIGIVRPAVEI